jgi:hypothetical protein
MNARRIAAVLAGSLLALGCFVDDGPIPGAGSASTAEATDAATMTSPTSSASSDATTTTTTTSTTDPTSATTMTTSPTSTSATTTSATTTSSTTSTTNPGTSSGSTGEPLEPLPQACSDYCDAVIACGLEATPTCVDECVAVTTMDPNPSDACVSAAISFAACAADLSCAAIGDPVQNCGLQAELLVDACPPCAVKVDAFGSACTLSRDCQVDHFFAECSQGTCYCSQNEVRGRTCQFMDDPCGLAEAELIVQIDTCCKWSP